MTHKYIEFSTRERYVALDGSLRWQRSSRVKNYDRTDWIENWVCTVRDNFAWMTLARTWTSRYCANESRGPWLELWVGVTCRLLAGETSPLRRIQIFWTPSIVCLISVYVSRLTLIAGNLIPKHHPRRLHGSPVVCDRPLVFWDIVVERFAKGRNLLGELHCESKKLCHFYFYCNFGKCWSIFKILSMSESERKGS